MRWLPWVLPRSLSAPWILPTPSPLRRATMVNPSVLVPRPRWQSPRQSPRQRPNPRLSRRRSPHRTPNPRPHLRPLPRRSRRGRWIPWAGGTTWTTDPTPAMRSVTSMAQHIALTAVDTWSPDGLIVGVSGSTSRPRVPRCADGQTSRVPGTSWIRRAV